MNGVNERVVFDSCIMISRLRENNPLSGLNTLFFTADQFISVITRMELLSYHGITDSEKHEILNFLDGVTVIPLFDKIEESAITFRQQTKLKLPDSIIAATAIVVGAKVVTSDPHLLKAQHPGFRVETL